jgi:hypothetical protein
MTDCYRERQLIANHILLRFTDEKRELEFTDRPMLEFCHPIACMPHQRRWHFAAKYKRF